MVVKTMLRRSFIQLSSAIISSAFLGPAHLLAQTSSAFLKRLKGLGPHVYTPGDLGFDSLKEIINGALKLNSPTAIIQSNKKSDNSKAIKLSQEFNQKVRLRCGGHSFEGFSMGEGVVIDVRKNKEISLNEEDGVLKLGSGLLLHEVISGVDPLGLTFPVGSCPTVGISGFLLGGGHSLKSRSYGLGADRVQSMNVTLANGDILEVSPTENDDLYWALLGGGGGSFALVNEFRVDPMPKTLEVAFDFTFPVSKGEKVFNFWEEHSYSGADDISAVLIMSARGGRIANIRIHGVINLIDSLERRSAKEIFDGSIWRDLREFQPASEKIRIRSSNYVRKIGQNIPFKGTSHYAEEKIGVGGYKTIKEKVSQYIERSATLVFEPMGGVINRPKRMNSYPHRNTRYIIEFHTSLFSKSRQQRDSQNLVSLHQSLDSLFSKRCYVNYPDFDLGSDWSHRYYGDSLERLLQVKRKYDPSLVLDYGRHSLAGILRSRGSLGI